MIGGGIIWLGYRNISQNPQALVFSSKEPEKIAPQLRLISEHTENNGFIENSIIGQTLSLGFEMPSQSHEAFDISEERQEKYRWDKPKSRSYGTPIIFLQLERKIQIE